MLLFSVGASLNPISSAARSTPQSDQLDPVAGVELAAAQHGYLHVRPTDRADRYAVHVFFLQQGADGLARYPFFIDDDRQRFDREVDQFLVLDLASDPCFLFDDEPAAPADDDFVAPADDGFRGGILDRSLLSEALDENPLLLPGHVLLELAYRPPRLEPLVVGAEGAENDRTRRRVESRTEAHVVPHLRFHLLGRLLYFRDAAEQPRAEGAEYPGRSGRAVDVGDRVADRHHAQVRVASAGQLVNRIGGGSDDGRHRLRAGQQAGRLRRVVAHDDRAAPYREQTHHADDYREADLRETVFSEPPEELGPYRVADRE